MEVTLEIVNKKDIALAVSLANREKPFFYMGFSYFIIAYKDKPPMSDLDMGSVLFTVIPLHKDYK